MSQDRHTAETVEIPLPGPSSHKLGPETGSARVQVDLAALSHQGLVRAANEDHRLVMRFGRTLETVLTSLPVGQMPARFEEVGYGLLVADGMGGAAAGEVAGRPSPPWSASCFTRPTGS
jgi:PPM family protein phosphatase